jgi:diacylglycerol O-acyltransferase
VNRIVGPDRTFAVLRASVDLARKAARANDATVNDVLLTVTAGGLRALLGSRGEVVEGVWLPVYVPVSLRRRLRGPQQGNEIAQMVVPIPLGVSDPVVRLRQIAVESARRRKRTRVSLGTLFRGRIVRRLALKAAMRQRVNVTTASIPRPRRSLDLAGARLLEVFPVLPLIANEPLGVGALSYAGTLSIGISADRDAFPDFDVLATAMSDDLHELGVSADRLPAGRAAATSPAATPFPDPASGPFTRSSEPALPVRPAGRAGPAGSTAQTRRLTSHGAAPRMSGMPTKSAEENR